MKWQDAHCSSIVKTLGLQDLSSEERRERLLNMPADEIVEKLPAFMHWSQTIDGTFIHEDIIVGQVKDMADARGKPKWCKEVLVGDAAHDVRSTNRPPSRS
jgi:hypothetical protein